MSMHHMALQSTTQGFQIALQIGLNNQDLWPNDNYELASRQGLWWTVYFLDKRLTQKCGITYFLREDESAVSDFSNLNHTLSSRNHETLQALVLFSRLWALIWDGFFSPQAPKADDWRESQMMDTRIVIEYRQIPTKLHWKSSMVSEYIFTDGETRARQRLIVFLRFQSLRLSIRHKTLSSDEHDVERRKTVITICEAIVEAIRSYMVMAAWLKPLGYILTTALVECLYYILPEECHPTPVVSNKLLKDLIYDASQALQSLSKLVATASKIYQSLKDLLPSDNALDSFDASSHDQQAVDQTMPLNCFSDLDATSETFWEGFSNKSPIPRHTETSHRAIPFSSMGPSEIFTTEGLPVHFDDLQSQILSDLSLDNPVFGAFPFDYKTTQFEKDQLSRPFGSI
ncbi:hypothetical protein N7488_003374 [Penicillium malachiteum]|nr:hypothetical protein N7488_003374 [Penicillium malachiteum]